MSFSIDQCKISPSSPKTGLTPETRVRCYFVQSGKRLNNNLFVKLYNSRMWLTDVEIMYNFLAVLRDEIYENFGRLVAERRKRSKITQEAFAKALNLSRASIANIERGKQAVQLHLIFQIATILNAEVQEFIPSLNQGIHTIQVQDWLERIQGNESDTGPFVKMAATH